MSPLSYDDSHSLDRHDFNGRALVNQCALSNNIRALTVDERGAGGAQLSNSHASAMKQFGLGHAQLTDGAPGNERSGDAAFGEEF